MSRPEMRAVSPLKNRRSGISNGTIVLEGQFDDPVEAPTPRGAGVVSLNHDPPATAHAHTPNNTTLMTMQRPIFHPGYPMMAISHGMQPLMIRPAQYVLVPQQPMVFTPFPQAYQAALPPIQPTTTAATPPATRPQTPPTAWHIPMSHNYHPAATLDPESNKKETKSDAALSLMRLVTLHPAVKEVIQTPPNPIAESNPMFEDGESFPVIKEDSEMIFPIAEHEINDVDILCGRGGATNAHPGNIHFRNIVDYYRLQYGTVKKIYKANIAKTIVKEIRKRHGRFLKKSDTCDIYYEIGDIKARNKTSQTLREGMTKLMHSRLVVTDEEASNKRPKT